MRIEPKLEIERIEKSLGPLVTQMLRRDRAAERRRLSKGLSPVFSIRSAAEICAEPMPTEFEAQANRIIQDPVRGACKNAVRVLGERLFELTGGDTTVMQKIAERVIARGGRYSQYRAMIIDKTWDGIGEGAGGDCWIA